MNRRRIPLTIGAVFLAACGGLCATRAAAQQRVEQRFDELDRNGDAKVTPNELPADLETGRVHSPWANDRSLAEAEKRNLLEWLAGGRPAGDPADAPAARAYPEGWQIGVPDAVFEFAEPVAVKATGVMPYQTVIVETRLHEVRVAGIVNPQISIPPGAADHREEASLRLPFDATVMGFLPHLHVRGKACRYELIRVAGGPSSRIDRSLPWVTEEAAAPRVTFHTFESRAAAGKVSYHVFSPSEYDEPDARLPVLYWLHGTLGGVAGIRPLAAHFDTQIRSGQMPPLLVVFVNGLPRRLWADSKDGSAPVETVFITELIPEVDRSFRTVAAREGRILEGFSMGGYGAARLGFKHPDLFAGISILAGGPLDLDFDGPRARRNPQLRDFIMREVCGGDLGYFRALSPMTLAERAAAPLRERKTLIRQAVGTCDDTRDLNHRFHERMTVLGIDHGYHEIPDVGHDAAAVLAALAATDGDFYRRALAAPDPEDP